MAELRSSRPGHHRAFVFWITVATLAALALRLYNLDVAGFWVDELYSLYVTADVRITHNSKVLGYVPTWLGLWATGVDPSTLPQQDFDASQWQQLGITHANARLGSAVVGVLTVPALAFASRRLLGTGPAVMLAFLLATSPWHIYWSQAARFYTVQFLFYTLALIFYFTSTRIRSRPQFALAMAFVVLAFLSQPTALAILAIFGADWLIAYARRRPLPIGFFEWGVGTIAIAICAAIFLNDYFSAPDQWAQFVAFSGAEYQPPHRLGMGSIYMTGPAIAVAAIAAAWALWRTQERLVLFLLISALLPIGIFAAWSLGNAVGLRYLLICLYGWLALAAVGLDRLGTLIYSRAAPLVTSTRMIRSGSLLSIAPLAVIIASSAHLLLGYYTSARGFHPRWPEAYQTVAARAQPGDIIAARHPIVARYYLKRPDIVHLPDNADHLKALAPDGQRIWLIVESRGRGDTDIGRWIYDHATLEQVLEIMIPHPSSRVEVLLFGPRPQPATELPAPSDANS